MTASRSPTAHGEDRAIDFARDVQPIFSAHCYDCHGPDAQEGGLRLSRKQNALTGGDNGEVILPGNAAGSKLLQLAAGLGEEGKRMPPADAGAPLSAEQVATLRAWIDQGANWPDGADATTVVKSDHWSFQPVRNASPPRVSDAAWLRNPIDAFVLSRLEAEGILPSPEADRATLLRRVSLDVRGLPPTPQEYGGFLGDEHPAAYERMLDRMLASPHYGERFARHWLDLARYADSDGYEKDTGRPHAWRYRHWLIAALNADMPFNQFTIEQLAGDLLPNADTEQRVATGFHRNTLTNREGGIDPEEDRVKQTVDRLNTTGATWLGLTVGCAQCHTHKYDPISQREYYALYAFFNSLQEVDVPAPLVSVDPQYEQAKQKFEAELAVRRAKIEEFMKDALPLKQTEWEDRVLSEKRGGWTVLKPEKAASAGGATTQVQDDGSVLLSGENPAADTYVVESRTDLPRITAIRVEALADASLPSQGPGRTPHGNFVLSEFSVRAAQGHAQQEPAAVALQNAVADFAQGQDMKEFPPSAALDGDKQTGWAIVPQTGRDHAAVFETAADVMHEGGTRLIVMLDQQHGSQHTIGRFRISVTGDPRPVGLNFIPAEIMAIVKLPSDQRSDEQRAKLAEFYRGVDATLKKLNDELASFTAQSPQRHDQSMAQTLTELPTPRETRLLVRGDFLRPGAKVSPGTPEALPPLASSGESPTRLDLARWLVDPANPLTPRVTANRAWHNLFGRGLVETNHDFGTQGEPPSHPELLDWLAGELAGAAPNLEKQLINTPLAHARGSEELNWSLKALHRVILSSAAYRQSSHARPELKSRDPYNKLLARQNRLRVEAEVVRDLALAVSGLLAPRIGGPSVRPPQPAGIDELAYAGSVQWKASEGPDRYRRGVYTFFQRTVPYPMFMDFDAPDSNVACTRRERSNTPIAALTLQNDPVFVEVAQALARRLLIEHPGHGNENCDDMGRAKLAGLLCLGRINTIEERGTIVDLYRAALAHFQSQPAEAAALAGLQPKPDGVSDAELAGWVLVGRTLLNLDEFITRE